MKLVLVPLMMLLLFTQAFSKWFVVLEYHMNKDFISQKLCVNKAKPKLHCNGKCQMMKRLAEEEKQNSSNTGNNTSKLKIQDVVLYTETSQPPALLLISTVNTFNAEPPLLKYGAPSSSIFHPPALA